MRLLREPLLHFLLIGGTLLLAQGWWLEAARHWLSPPQITVSQLDRERLAAQWRRETGRAPAAAEMEALVQQHIDEELLFREALRLGLQKHDAVIRQRLITNMRFAEQNTEAGDEELFNAALALGMLRSDPVVRRRLIQKIRHRVENRIQVTETQARTYYQQHKQTFSSPAYYHFEQRFFDARQGDAAARAHAALQTLNGNPADAAGDPFLLGTRFEALSLSDVRRRLGTGIADALASAPTGQWIGPVTSVYGQHLLRVVSVSESAIPQYTQLRSRITAQLYSEQERAAVENLLHDLRRHYRIRVAGSGTGEAA